MSNLNSEYQKIISDIEKNITDPKDLSYIKEKISELATLFMNTVDRVIEYSKENLNNVSNKQEDLEERVESIQKSLDNLEKEMYSEEEEDFEVEVICPYCNHQFSSNIDLEDTTEIQCPECKNMIELDWNDEDDEEQCKRKLSSDVTSVWTKKSEDDEDEDM